MLPKFSSLFSKKEPADKPASAPSVPPPQPVPAVPPKPPAPHTAPIPRPGQMGVTRVLPTPVPQGLRTPLRAPLPSPTPIDPSKNKKRITQRITVNVPPSTVETSESAPGKLVIPAAKTFSEFQPQKSEVAGTLQVPLQLILKALPSQILTPDAQKIIDQPESSPCVPLPLGPVLAMLPSGKLEFPIREFLPLLPGSVIQPMDESAAELQMLFVLPLPEIFKLIPSEYVTKRRDQKPVDPKVMAMADPFSESELRKKAEAAQALAQESAQVEAQPAPQEFQKEAPAPILPPVPEPIPGLVVENISEETTLEKTEAVAEATSPSREINDEPQTETVASAPLPPPEDLLSLLAKANQEVEKSPTAETMEISEKVIEPINIVPLEIPTQVEEIPPTDFAAAIRQLAMEEESTKQPDSPSTMESASKEPEVQPSDEGEIIPQAESLSAPLPSLRTEEKIIPEVVREEEVPDFSKKQDEEASPVSSGIDVNRCNLDDLVSIGCPEGVARKILAWRELHGVISDIRRIRSIPGVTNDLYRAIVGLPEAGSLVNRELNEAFGLPTDQSLTVKDVASCIRRWPFMVACVIGGMEGLPIAYDGEDAKYADLISAFVPKLFQQTNSILDEIEENKTQEIHLVKDGRSLSIYCCRHLFLATVNLRKDVSGRESDLIREIVTRLSELKESKLKA